MRYIYEIVFLIMRENGNQPADPVIRILKQTINKASNLKHGVSKCGIVSPIRPKLYYQTFLHQRKHVHQQYHLFTPTYQPQHNIQDIKCCPLYYTMHIQNIGGWDSIVGIATRNRLDSLGMKFWWGRNFPHLSRLALGPI